MEYVIANHKDINIITSGFLNTSFFFFFTIFLCSNTLEIVYWQDLILKDNKC